MTNGRAQKKTVVPESLLCTGEDSAAAAYAVPISPRVRTTILVRFPSVRNGPRPSCHPRDSTAEIIRSEDFEYKGPRAVGPTAIVRSRSRASGRMRYPGGALFFSHRLIFSRKCPRALHCCGPHEIGRLEGRGAPRCW
ncbi:hypothetical protein ACLOJK_007376 [Asimina triloba]